jgi:phage-related protein
MAEVGSAFVSILPSARGFGSKLQSDVGGEVDGAGQSIGSRFGNFFKVAALAAVGGAILVGKFLKGAVEEAREAQVVTARTENVIKSMGNVAGISAKQVEQMAGRLSAVTGIDDEAIQSGENLLLTFGKVRNFVDGQFVGTFDEATRLALDMSVAMGTDMKGAAIQVGKALNDPIKGVSALTRVGVSFTEAQKKQIEGFVEGGNVAKAQGVILGELQKQFGGAAEAMATPADKARTAYANLKEQIGTALLPVIDSLLNTFVSATPAISSAIAGIGPAFASIRGLIEPVIASISSMFSGGAGGGLIAGILAFATSVKASFLPVLQTMSATFTGTILPAVTSLATYLASSLFPVFAQVADIVGGQVVPIVASLATFLYGTLYPAVVGVATAVASNLKPVFDQLVSTFRSSVLPAIEQILAKFREWQPTIQKVIGIVVQIIGKVLEFAAAILGKVLPPVIRFAGFLLSNLVPAVIGVISVVVKIIGKVIEFGVAVVNAVRTMIGWVKDKATDAWNFLRDKVVSAAAAILKPIEPIIDKLRSMAEFVGGKLSAVWDGFKSAATGAVNAVRDAVQWVIDKVQALIDKIQSIPGIPGGDAGGNGNLVGGLPRASLPTPQIDTALVGRRAASGDVIAELRALRQAVLTVAPGVASGLNGVAAAAARSV